MPALVRKPYTSSKTRVCKYCSKSLNVKGFTSHEKACGRRFEASTRDILYENDLLRERIENLRTQSERPVERTPSPPILDTQVSDRESVGHNEDGQDSDMFENEWHTEEEFDELDDEVQVELDDIKVEYHRYAKRSPDICHFHEFNRERDAINSAPEEVPWEPFRCRTDFEFASVALEAALKREHVNKLIKLINEIAEGRRFTLSGERDLAKLWEKASKRLTPFKQTKLEVPFKREIRTYSLWFRPLWDWTLDLLMDDRLAPHFHWDAERLYKYDGTSFVRFIDEPWTAERFWQTQSNLPEGSHPFAWIIYADKNKLSTFGTEKGHPVVARCANLPIAIRNGSGVGGGRIVGWLPIVKDESENKGKLSWTNHKRAVWHEALRVIMKSMKSYSKTGFNFRDRTGVERRVFPCVMILSADYDEQTFMALIRGLTGLYPCPVCLTPLDQQHDLSLTHEHRTMEKTKALLKQARGLKFKPREEKLKAHGLRNLENAFWTIKNSDPHKAISWDRLHSYSSGLFGAHIWHNLKLCFKELGRDAQDIFDKEIESMPRFRGLHHFSEALQIYFNDGSKFESLAKQTLYAAHNVLTEERSKHGYILLRCLRSFLILDTYLSFEVHTYATISSGERELRNFSQLIMEYVQALPTVTKFKFTSNWDFIKMHSHKHAFSDIRNKGVTSNYSTKPNEKLHKPLRDAYQLRTNFKEVAKQILKIDHHTLVCTVINSRIEELDEFLAGIQRENTETATGIVSQYSLGSAKKNRCFFQLEQENAGDAAFSGFRVKFAQYLTTFMSAHSIALPNNRRIILSPEDKITPYRLVKVTYENMVTWKASTDYLRCNPKFHGRPRYDAVIFRTVNGDLFGRLIFLFNYVFDGENYPTALIQPCHFPTGRRNAKDTDLGLVRVIERQRASPEFVTVRSIVRGAVLVPDSSKDGEYIVMDILDADMFLRVRSMI